MSRFQTLRSVLAMGLMACLLGGLAAPAHADDWRYRRDVHHDPHWRPPPARVVPAPVYAPPPVVYTPPPPVSPGISLVIPFNFR